MTLTTPTITFAELENWKASAHNFILLDIRELHELKQFQYQNALHIPFTEIMQNLHRIPDNTDIIIACHLGERSALLTNYLIRKHSKLSVFNLKGGLSPYYLQS